MSWTLHYLAGLALDEGLRYPTRQWRLRIAVLIEEHWLMRA